jgi:uncharacterized protein
LKKIIALLTVILLTIATVSPAPAYASRINIPQPTDFFYVNDLTHTVLSPETITRLVNLGDQLYERTGAQVVLTIVDFVGNANIEEYSRQMGDQWGIGSEIGNGLLILYATEETFEGEDEPGMLWVQRGVDLERRLSVAAVNNILDLHFDPDFEAGNLEAALVKTFEAFVERLGLIYADVIVDRVNQLSSTTVVDTGDTFIEGFWRTVRTIIIVIVVIFVIMIILGAMFPRRRGYGGHMGGPMMPRRRGFGGFFMGYGLGRLMTPRRPRTTVVRPSRPPSGGSGSSASRPRTGGGGSFGGGGIGRGGGLGGGSRPGGLGGGSRPSGGIRTGGGGSFRGGGIGRR